MPAMSWTLPVARWSCWSSHPESTPEVAFVDPMMRRRLSSLSRMALQVADDCVDARTKARVVFGSRHGELRRTTEILSGIEAGKPVSPNAFSLSVLNAMTGLFGISRQDRSAATAVSAGAQTLGYALLEAYAQWSEDAAGPVLMVYADEAADARYGEIEHEVRRGAFALLIEAGAASQGELACTVAQDARGGERRFDTQSEALQHCLSSGEQAVWRGNGVTWQWSWHAGTA
ncbi:beta-ketoacyl synthase chain length factor [Paraburkholderia acidisoli]|uniref:Beta-ketoacyl synthase-like N-terminal domain-containing protein n=1 Tax=Paraburkholderia acidisoli TaxID=2571748 RepID=A0A7Z2GMM7_9BURK|nr:beta-ketoacyl synthase chain length factor [Paraburkholderia acidisoli]QGZ64620.1 hypothetical protein FAZ98_22545 [Paraburkholderia acidisoli]